MKIYVNDLPERPPPEASRTNGAATAAEGTGSRSPAEAVRDVATSPWGTTLSFLVPDVVAFALAGAALYAGGETVAGLGDPLGAAEAWLWPAAGLLIGSFAAGGLYHRALTMHPVQELRAAALLTTVVFFAYAATLALADAVAADALVGLGLAWGLVLPLLLLARATSRILFARADWWGAPVLVLASRKSARTVVRNLQRWPELGLRPAAVIAPPYHAGDGHAAASAASQAEHVSGVPLLHDTRRAPKLMHAANVPYVLVNRPDLDHRSLTGLLRRCSQFCRQVFVVRGLDSAAALWTGQQDFQGFSGYGVRHADTYRLAHFGKRLFDAAGALVGLLATAPLLLVIAVLTKLDSPGPVLYRQLRVGRKGRCFTVLKFRTMHTDAEARLEELLQQNDALRAEYEVYHKLQHDPRITRLGAILRKTSLDELPQLWNVLKGDMSLTGPRAYTPGELSDMDDLERVILQRRPGLSGLWQVSGRNALSFEERTRMDVHYVHHWSFWLDLYILARTLPAVVEQENTA